jgi:uncharacterized protein (TIGR00304 family)
MVSVGVFYGLGVALIVVGIVVIVAAIIFASTHCSPKSKVKGAAVIMIGPIPIIFGSDRKSSEKALVLAIVLVALLIVLYLLLR